MTAQRTVLADASQLAVLNQFLREFWTRAELEPASLRSLELPPADVSAGLVDRREGGLGVHLVRNTMDTVSYARIAGRNRLRIAKRLDG